MKRYFFVILFSICFFNKNAYSQNLVLNSSFENLSDTCFPYDAGIYFKACAYWDCPIYNTPDYFNSCANSLQQGNFGVPSNFLGGG